MEQEHFESMYPETARFGEIEEILTYVNEGKSCQLVGLPGAGRSTVLGLLAYNKSIRVNHLAGNQKNVHFVMANFSEIRKRPLFDAMKFLFLSLADSLRARDMDEDYRMVNEIFKERLEFSDELVLFQGLKEAIDYLALERKMTIVFLFDRFDEYVPTVTSEFFTNLRTLRNRAKYRFSVIFSLNRPLGTVLEPSLLADYYEFVAGNIVFLNMLDEPATKFRISYIEKITGKKIPAGIKEEILALTGGHGKLSKLAIESFFSNGTKKDLADFFLTQKSIKAALLEIWNSLSPAEQQDLVKEKYDDEEVERYLTAVGLLKNKKSQIPLLTQFLKKEFSVPELQKQEIIYDQNTNTIRKGDIVLSDKLTSSEFRLLRFLLQNQDRIVEREEIIGVVWQDVKSTAGITDQAVDQLVFRVRRKIEEDPNTPNHFQTIKGRGFRFLA